MRYIKVEIKWTIIAILTIIVWASLERIFGFHGKYIDYYTIASSLVVIPLAFIFYYALKEKGRIIFAQKMLYDQALGTGLMLTMFIILLLPLAHLLQTTVISPHYLDSMKRFSIETHVYSAEDADKNFSFGGSLLHQILFFSISGAVISLIVGGIISKKKTL